MACYLYKHLSESGEVLYVGISINVLQRTVAHRSTAQWFHMVKCIEIMRFPSKEEALHHEEELVKTIKPRFNVEYLLERNMNSRAHRRAAFGDLHDKLKVQIRQAIEAHGEVPVFRAVGMYRGALRRFLHEDSAPLEQTIKRVAKCLEGLNGQCFKPEPQKEQK